MPHTPKDPIASKAILVVLGGPGSGKGTHGRALAAALRFEHLSTGEQLRDHIRRATPLGRQVSKFIETGQLVPDELAAELIKGLLTGRSTEKGFVLDGFPRSLAQAKALEEIVAVVGCAVRQALYLVVSEEEIVRRLSGRLTCRTCGKTYHESANPSARRGLCDRCGGELFRRVDDEPATIRRRIAVFHETITPLLAFYRETGRLIEIAAEGPVQEVSARVVARARAPWPLVSSTRSFFDSTGPIPDPC